MTEEDHWKRRLLFQPCSSQDELSDWIFTYLGLRMPDCIVDPASNSSPMDMIWFTYSKCLENDEDFAQVLFYASRDSFKTLAAAVIEVLGMFHLGRSVAHLAAVLTQSTKAQSYLKKFLRRNTLSDFLVGDAQRSTSVVWYTNHATGDILTKKEYESLQKGKKIDFTPSSTKLTEYTEYDEYINVLVATLAGVNSEHVLLLVIDEVEVVKQAAVMDEAKNIPAPKDGKLPITVMTSTRKFRFGFVQKEIDNAPKTGTIVKHWNIIDVTEKCPAKRHLPHLPKLPIYSSVDRLHSCGEEEFNGLADGAKASYTKDEGYNGCLTKCKIFFACKGRLATEQKSQSKLLRPIATVQNKFRTYATNVQMAKAQLLCLNPESTGLVYPRFDPATHVLSPDQAYKRIFGEDAPEEELAALGADKKGLYKSKLIELLEPLGVRWVAGADYGSTHPFVYAHGFVYGGIVFITHIFAAPGLDPEQTLRAIEQYLKYNPECWGDPENPQMVKVMKKAGFHMKKWKKGPGSVLAGIGVLQGKMFPPFGDQPEFYFIRDVSDDPQIDLAIEHMQEYHYKLDTAGVPTDVPDEENDDIPDAIRYLVMNATPTRTTSLQSVGQDDDFDVEIPIRDPFQVGEPVYDQKNWMRQLVAEATGEDIKPLSWDNVLFPGMAKPPGKSTKRGPIIDTGD